MEILKYIRRKPRYIRELYAYYFAFACTGIVAFFWVLHIPGQMANVSTSLHSIENPSPQSTQDSSKPFSGFLDWVKSSMDNVNIVDQDTDQKYSATTTEISDFSTEEKSDNVLVDYEHESDIDSLDEKQEAERENEQDRIEDVLEADYLDEEVLPVDDFTSNANND